MTAISIAPPPVQIEENLPCMRCGYNLRTLAADSRCPECSTPITSSLNRRLLRYADPSWTSILAIAFGLMAAGVLLQFASYVILLILQRVDTVPGLPDVWNYGHVLLKVYEFGDPLFWLGVFLLGYPGPQATSPQRHFSIRRAMRFVSLLALVRAILPEMVIPEFWAGEPIGYAIELLATIVTFLYLLTLARKTELSRIMRHTIMAMGALILIDCYAILTEIFSDQDWVELSSFYVGWLIAAIFLYIACVFWLFRGTLRKSAAFARQYWHFCSPLP